MFKKLQTHLLTNGVKSNTLAVFIRGERSSVLFHETLVLEFDGEFMTLQSGGFDMVSTRIVINRVMAQLPGFRSFKLIRSKGKTWLVMPDASRIENPFGRTYRAP